MLALDILRHSTAHVMAAAVGRLFGPVLFDIGPATDDGFYYDFDLTHRLTPDDFPAIEAEMAKLVRENLPFERLEVTRGEAAALLAGQTFKLERLADIPAGETISLYRCGGILELCPGPPAVRTGALGAFNVLSVAVSYYRGK